MSAFDKAPPIVQLVHRAQRDDGAITAEQALLGSLLLHCENPAEARRVCGLADALSLRDFADEQDRRIFQRIRDDVDANGLANQVTVTENLNASGELASYIGFLAMHGSAAETIPRYVELIKKKARLRAYRALGAAIQESASDDPDELHGYLLTSAEKIKAEGDRLSGADAARIGDIFTVPPKPPQFTIENLLPVNVGVEAAAGGLGKTTRHQFEHIHVVNGLPLYGRSILRPGPVLVVTKEDTRDELLYRYYMIATQMGLTDAQRRAVKEDIYIEDLSGSADRLVLADPNGNLVATDLGKTLVRRYAGRELSLVEFDPLNFFGPGERFVNDGEAMLMEVGRFVSRELGCPVRFTAHVSKEASRGRYVDAHAGRGGSAGADNARFVHVFVPHDKKDEELYPAPAGVSPEVIAQQRLHRLHLPKVSGAPPMREPIWLIREAFLFHHVEAAAPLDQRDRERADVTRLRDFVAAELRQNVKHTRNSLEQSLAAHGISRDRLRRALHIAVERGSLAELPLPEDQCKGGRKTYLVPAVPGEVAAT